MVCDDGAEQRAVALPRDEVADALEFVVGGVRQAVGHLASHRERQPRVVRAWKTCTWHPTSASENPQSMMWPARRSSSIPSTPGARCSAMLTTTSLCRSGSRSNRAHVGVGEHPGGELVGDRVWIVEHPLAQLADLLPVVGHRRLGVALVGGPDRPDVGRDELGEGGLVPGRDGAPARLRERGRRARRRRRARRTRPWSGRRRRSVTARGRRRAARRRPAPRRRGGRAATPAAVEEQQGRAAVDPHCAHRRTRPSTSSCDPSRRGGICLTSPLAPG